jgi:hypothetical protein
MFIFLFNYFSPNMQIGYAYNKLASVLSPLIVSLVIIGFFNFIYTSNNIKFSLAPFFFFLFVTSTSFSTLIDLKNFSSQLNIDSARDVDIRLKDCNCILLTFERGYRDGLMNHKMRYSDRTADLALASIMSTPMVDQWIPNHFRLLPSGKTIYVMLRQDSLNKISKSLNYSFIYSNNFYTIYDTHLISDYFASLTDIIIAKEVQKLFDSFKT